MSGCSGNDAARFQRASSAAGQICCDLGFIGLGLGQRSFQRVGSTGSLGSIVHSLLCEYTMKMLAYGAI